MPAAWTAANLSFRVSQTAGGSFTDLYTEAGVEAKLSAVPAQGKAYSIETLLPALAPWRWVIVRSGLTGATVTQLNAAPIVTFIFQR